MKTKTLIKIFSNPLTTIYYLVIAVFLSLVIAFVYKKTHKSVSYSRSFVNSLVMLVPMVSVIINIVNNNVARAIGVFGAFSITRFRTPIKDSRDMVYIFWCLVAGLAVGSGEIGIAITSVLVLAGLALLLDLTNFGATNDYDYLLVASLDTNKGKVEDLISRIGKYTRSKEIVNIQSDKNGHNLEISLNIKLRKNISINTVVDALNKAKGVNGISANPVQNGIEF